VASTAAWFKLERVRSLHLSAGEAEVILASGARLPLSRRYRKDVQARLALGA
jgi:DNA-binding LytR/AlgR family response regulator